MNKENTQELILKSLQWRYATKIFDASQKIDEDTVATILESARLSPSSLGLEPWKFFVINDTELRKKIFEASKQPKVLDASHLIVLAAQTDIDKSIDERIVRTAKTQQQQIEELASYRLFLENAVKEKRNDGSLTAWLRAQTYIPLGAMVLTASLLGVDNCPMEGFDIAQIDDLLQLKDQNLTAVTMLALGTRGEDPQALRPKVRRSQKDAINII